MFIATSDLNYNEEALDELLADLASQVEKRGMRVPAIFFLEMYKPLTGILHAATILSVPILLPIFGAAKLSAAQKLLASPEHVERLIQNLERME